MVLGDGDGEYVLSGERAPGLRLPWPRKATGYLLKRNAPLKKWRERFPTDTTLPTTHNNSQQPLLRIRNCYNYGRSFNSSPAATQAAFQKGKEGLAQKCRHHRSKRRPRRGAGRGDQRVNCGLLCGGCFQFTNYFIEESLPRRPPPNFSLSRPRARKKSRDCTTARTNPSRQTKSLPNVPPYPESIHASGPVIQELQMALSQAQRGRRAIS